MPKEDSPKPEIELKSEEVKEILGHIPHWIIRWGTVLVFLVIAVLLAGSWLFRYPDMVTAGILVTTENPPSNAVARTTGKIMSLEVKDNQEVSAGQVLALIENPGNYRDVAFLRTRLDSFRLDADPAMKPSGPEFPSGLQLGDIQPDYADFLKQYNDYLHFVDLDYHNQKIGSLKEEIKKYKDYSARLSSQSKILKQEQSLAYRQFKRDSTLFSQGVIPESDYEKSKTSYLQKEYAYEQSRITIASNDIQVSKLSQDILDLDLKRSDDLGKLRSALEEAADKLSASLAGWEHRYVLRSAIDGVVSFTRIWSRNQEVREGDLVMSVIPRDPGRMIGKLNLRLSGAGKVKPGQTVNIKFDNYPYLEFGMVRGTIRTISLVASDNEYSVIVDLPEGLKTGYGTELSFTQDMQGTAEVITNHRRLLERIVLPVRAVFARQRQIKG